MRDELGELLETALDADTKVAVLLLLWRVWHRRNDIMHGKGKASIDGSVEFLKNYATSLKLVSTRSQYDQRRKGKEKILEGRAVKETARVQGGSRPGIGSRWLPPQEGWAKLNSSDAGFITETGRAGTGVLIRDVHGEVIISAWRSLHHVASVVEAEVLPCLEGLRLARPMGWPASVCRSGLQATGANAGERGAEPIELGRFNHGIKRSYSSLAGSQG
jgi:hypothetical protein